MTAPFNNSRGDIKRKDTLSLSTPSSSPQRPENRITAPLSTDYQHLLSQPKRATLSRGEVVCDPGDHIDYVYFPETAVLLRTLENGAAVQVWPVGHEGMVRDFKAGIALRKEQTATPVTPLYAVLAGNDGDEYE